jgi:perosamine synthetase
MAWIPVYQPSLTGNERAYVNEALDSGWISSKGVFIGRFEEAFAARIGVRHALTVANGTVALHLCLLALGLGPGDEVIVPAFTYIASVNCITYVGATPVFADSCADTWQLDPEEVRRRITPRTRAIMAVHVYGHPCDLAALRALADEFGLYLVEDCAEAFGSTFEGREVGTWGDIGAFSFFGNKTITTGEGGMVVTGSDELRDKVFRLKGQGLSKDREYWHDLVGYNYRMTNLQAAIGLAQLEQADAFIAGKRQLAAWYQEDLQGLEGVTFHPASPNVRHTYWMCTVMLDDASRRVGLRAHLAAQGIETRPSFPPIHLMPPYERPGLDLPVACSLGSRGLNLPSWPGLERGQARWIISELRTALRSAQE